MHHAALVSNRLTRSPDGYLAGVCEGLGSRLGVSPNLIRLVWLALALFAGTGMMLYLVLWWIVPRADQLPTEATIWNRASDGRYRAPLRRTQADRKLFGVCGGIARYWQVDPSLVRLAVLSLATLSLGLVAVAYLIAAAVIPGPNASTRTTVHPVEL